MSAQPKVTSSETNQDKPAAIRQVAPVAAKSAPSMMPKQSKPAPVRYDFVGIAG